MNNNRMKIRNGLCAVLCVVLAGILVAMLYTNSQKNQEKETSLEAMQEEASPYEEEMQELKAELAELKNSVAYSSEEAAIMVGFVATDTSDISYMEKKAETYQFFPVLILDCTMEMDVLKKIIGAADDTWEIMLYAPTFSEEVNEDVLTVSSYLESVEKAHTGVFFLRSDYSNDSNIQLLKDDGFIGYTSYNSKTPNAGQTEDGMVYFDYSYLSVSGTSVASRIPALYSSKASMIFALDMNSMKEGTLTEDYVTEILDTLQSYTENDDCVFSTVVEVVAELSEVNAIEADNQEEYEKQAAEIQKRMDELEQTIDEIYDKAEY